MSRRSTRRALRREEAYTALREWALQFDYDWVPWHKICEPDWHARYMVLWIRNVIIMEGIGARTSIARARLDKERTLAWLKENGYV